MGKRYVDYIQSGRVIALAGGSCKAGHHDRQLGLSLHLHTVAKLHQSFSHCGKAMRDPCQNWGKGGKDRHTLSGFPGLGM
ncbi:hypothetical protein [Roseobacter sp. GAI101]|uniref:hypothetical protein n=1 Tax=Roseobacter sp. (strain GAI101) TaxID=391589 RepID=UPI0001871E8F|nr:hypothetical protein [Roseobacter sp. GAI101]EEB85893.1 hypothetical protein RGAI101_3048 [Roseobacter sp. GAI101]